MTEYVLRLVDALVADLMAAAPAIMLTGPRATGKTTTALRHVIDTARLDRPGEAAAFQADPDAALAARPTPLLIDEWHVVPGVLGAVKRAVDTDPRPGRYVIPTSWTPRSRPRSERRRPLRMRCRGSTTYGIGTVTRSTCCWTTGAAANLPSRSRRPLLRLDMTPGT